MRRRLYSLGLIIWLLLLSTLAFAEVPGIHVSTIEDRDHVTLMEFTGMYDHQPENYLNDEYAVRKAVAKEFYRTHPDDYDFLVIFTGFDFFMGAGKYGEPLGRYYSVKNDVSGIGAGLFDNSASFGSNGKLQGYIDMGPIARKVTNPTDPGFEETISTLSHEVMHRWGAYVMFRDQNGLPSMSLLAGDQPHHTEDEAHWNFLLHTQNSVLFGNDWKDNGDGTFTSQGRKRSAYSPLDLYLMGMIDKSQVSPFFLIENPDIDRMLLPEEGGTVSGIARTITIDDIIAVEGERFPSASDSQKNFKMAFIYLVSPGQTVEPINLHGINNIREAWGVRFIILTEGMGTMEVYPENITSLSLPPPPPLSGPRTTPADLNEGISWLLSQQNPDGSWGDSTATAVRDTVEVLNLLKTLGTSSQAFQKGVQWLMDHSTGPTIESYARSKSILGGGCEYIQSMRASDNGFPGLPGWGVSPVYAPNPMDTALALKAMSSGCFRKGDLIYLLDQQNWEGGWGATRQGSGTIHVTADVLSVLDRNYSTFLGNETLTSSDIARISESRGMGLQWLISRQNQDGGFGTSPSTVYDTATSVTLLMGYGSSYGDVISPAIDYLKKDQLADGSWNGSIWQTALAVKALRSAGLPNLTVKGSSLLFSIQSPTDGEMVSINARIENGGLTPVNNVIVRIYDGYRSQGGMQIGDDLVITQLSGQSSQDIQVLWDTTGKTGEHQIFVYIDQEGQIEESNESDNESIGLIAVKTPSVEPDLSIRQSDISADPQFIMSIPQELNLTAKVSNLGQTPVQGVKVWVYDGDPAAGVGRIAEQFVDIPGRSSLQMIIPVTLTTGGNHRLVIVADPLNEVADADRSDNSAYVNLSQVLNIELAVPAGSITFSQNPVPIGHDVTISVQVKNYGTLDAYSVPLRYSVEFPGGSIDLATHTLNVPAGGTVSDSFTWRTNRVLDQAEVVVHADPANKIQEASKANNRESVPLTVLGSTLPNLTITYNDISLDPSPAMQGGRVNISAAVKNNGFSIAGDILVSFYAGVPGSGGVLIGSQTISSLQPGESTTATLLWQDIAGFGERLIYVIADPVNSIPEFDEEDNSAFITVKVLSLPDLALTGGGINFTPAFPREGETVLIHVVVANNGEQEVSRVLVRAYEGNPSSGGVLIGEDRIIPHLPGKDYGEIQFTYTAVNGLREIFIQADPLDEIEELQEENNTASRTLGVQNANLWVTEPFFSPNGDGVKDMTTLFFRSVAGGVSVVDEDNAVVRDLTGNIDTGTNSVTWDGLDNTGRLAKDGQYRFVLNAPDGSQSGTVLVVLDTNNSPLYDAMGTKYLIEKEWGKLPGHGEFVEWPPDDRGMIISRWPTAEEWLGQTSEKYDWPYYGFFLVRPNGSMAPLSPADEWVFVEHKGRNVTFPLMELVTKYLYLSPDGNEVRTVIDREELTCGNLYVYCSTLNISRSISSREVWAFSTNGTGAKRLSEIVIPDGVDGASMQYLSWSPDGTKFLYIDNYGDVDQTNNLWVVDANNGSHTRVATLPVVGTVTTGSGSYDVTWSYIGGARWSADGEKIVYVTAEYFNNLPGYPSGASGGYVTFFGIVNPDGTENRRLLGTLHSWDWDDAINQAVFLNNGKMVLPPIHGGPDFPSIYDTNLTPLPVPSGEWQNAMINLDGSGLQYLAGSDWKVSASPDRLHFAVAGEIDGEGGFTIYNPEGTPEQRFKGGFSHFLNWSDMGQFAFVSDSGALSVMDVNTSKLFESRHPLPLGLAGNGYKALSPDGQYAVGEKDGSAVALKVKTDELVPLSTGFLPIPEQIEYKFKTIKYPKWIYIPETGWKHFAVTLSSSLNLYADMTFVKEGSQYIIRGTAADLNFDGFRLEYAGAGSSSWYPIGGTSVQEVVDGELARWIPPSVGSFYVRLTIWDKAGNEMAVQKLLAWAEQWSPITGIDVAPRLFSPNGDGTLDEISVRYHVWSPIHLDFTIYDSADSPVRTISRDHAIPSPASFTWDGRNESGAFVADGVYRIHVLDYDFFVTVDTKPPDVEVRFSGGLHRYSAEYNAFEAKYPFLEECVNEYDIDDDGSCLSNTPTFLMPPYYRIEGLAIDENMADWTLEAGQGINNPTEWYQFKRGTGELIGGSNGFRGIERLYNIDEDVADKKYRLRVTDQAGNKAVGVTEFAPKEVILYKWDGDGVPAGSLIYGKFNIIDIPGKCPYSYCAAVIIEQKPGLHTLSVVQSLRGPVQSLMIQYRLGGTPDWIGGPYVQNPPARTEISWDTSSLLPGRFYEVRVLVTGINGDEFVSNAIGIHSELFVMSSTSLNEDCSRRVTSGTVSLRENLKEIKLVTADAQEIDIGEGPFIPDNTGNITGISIILIDLEKIDSVFNRIQIRYKAIGQSGKVYYSNSVAVDRIVMCSSRSLGLEVTTWKAADWGEPNPQMVDIEFSVLGYEVAKLEIQEDPGSAQFKDFPLSSPEIRDAHLGGTLYRMTLDTTSRPEGIYSVWGRGWTSEDSWREKRYPPAELKKEFIVDRTPPDARITYPAQGQRLCPEETIDPSGKARLTVPVKGIAEDKNFDRYMLEYGVGEDPNKWSQFGDLQALQPGVLGRLNVTGLPDSTYTIRLKVWDKGGNLNGSSVSAFIDLSQKISGLMADQRLISPNGDGVSDLVNFSYTVDESAIVSTEVYRIVKGVAGQDSLEASPARTIQGLVLPGFNRTVWDGVSDSGAIVSDGRYAVVFHGTDSCGNTDRKQLEIEVDNTPPTADIAAPIENDTLPLVVQVIGTADDIHFQSYTLEAGGGTSPAAWKKLAGGPNPVSISLLGKWNIYGLIGPHTLRLTVEDQAGNKSVVTRTYDLPDRPALVSNLETRPALFSPNGDGKVDQTTISYAITESASVNLDILDKDGSLVRRLVEAQALQPDSFTAAWDGVDSQGKTVPDGEYTVRISSASAFDPSHTQSEKGMVYVDTTPPAVAFSNPPEGGFLSGDIPVRGSLSDMNIAEYAIHLRSDQGSFDLIESGTQPRADYFFTTLKGLADGRHLIKVVASDRAENLNERIISFTVDNTSPKVTLLAPIEGEIYGGASGAVDIKGTIEEANLLDYVVRFGSGTTPDLWTELRRSTSLPAAALLQTWSVGDIADGPYTISVLTSDKAGNSAEVQRHVKVDNTPPVVEITSPAAGAIVTGQTNILGTAADENLKGYTVEIAEGGAAEAFKWVLLGSSNQVVTNGKLVTLKTLPPDGKYTIRVTVADKAGLKTEKKIAININALPPSVPQDLIAQVENRSNVRLNWAPSTTPNISGYSIYRNGVKITNAPVADTTYFDANLSTGIYKYTVTAVDESRLESRPSNEARVSIDVTPPDARIINPANGGFVSGIVAIEGTAASVSQDDFKEYRLYLGEGSAPESWMLKRRSPAPVRSGLLYNWDILTLVEGGIYSIKLETEDMNGNVATAMVSVTVLNGPPATPILLSVVPSGSNIDLTWQPNTSSSMGGYLIFRNGVLVNNPSFAFERPLDYIITGSAYRDAALPDGDHTYYLIAVDKAGNISASSNSIKATVETRAPKAMIMKPAKGAKVGGPIQVEATSTDQDVSRVRFQYKSASAVTWIDLSTAITTIPYQIIWNPEGLPYGNYNFRAVATDVHNNTDPSPTPITIIYQDLTPPVSLLGLAVRITEGTATVSWSANTEADLQGYIVYRATGQETPVQLFSTPTTATTYHDSNLPDGQYAYTVTAVDIWGNESQHSNPAEAHVYTPVVSVAETCISEATTSLSGSGVEPNSTVNLFIDTGQGPVSSVSVAAMADGTFRMEGVPLSLGSNILTVQGVDSAGNRSKKSAPTTVQYSLIPATPISFTASVTSFDVSLGWDPVSEPLIAGYHLYRDGALLSNGIVDITIDGTPSALSYYSLNNHPQKAIDGDLNTYWRPYSGYIEPWWQIDFGKPISVEEIQINWQTVNGMVFGAKDFTVQSWDGSEWVIIEAYQGNTQDQNVIKLTDPLDTSMIRISIAEPIQSAFGSIDFRDIHLAEVKVLKPDYILVGYSFNESALSDGQYTYQLVAVNSCGVEGPAAEAVVSVGDVDPPAAPLNLAASVSDSDVMISYDAVTDPDLAGYYIYRTDGDGVFGKINDTPVTGTVYTDSLLSNGIYLYRATAADIMGNESEASNEATAVVDASLPAGIIELSVSAPPNGGILDISWLPGAPTKPVAGYRLFRSLTSGGPYEMVNQNLTLALSYRDTGLTNGVTYYYIVRAIDTAGNMSSPSNEGSGIPKDLVVPPSPVILYPADADHPKTVTVDITSVSGRAEAGDSVMILVDGWTVGTTNTALRNSVSERFALPAQWDDYSIKGERIAAFQMPPGSLDYVLAVTDAVTRETTYYDEVAGYNETTNEGNYSVAFLPGGQKIAYFSYSEATNGESLNIFDTVNRSVVKRIDLPENAWAGSKLVFLPDGSEAAFSLDNQIWTLDVSSDALTQITNSGDSYNYDPVWSSDGSMMAFTRHDLTTGTTSLLLVDLNSMVTMDIDSDAGEPVFSPDGKTLAYRVYSGGKAELRLYDIGSGTRKDVQQGTGDRSLPQFTSDGTGLIYIESDVNGINKLFSRNRSDGEVNLLAEDILSSPPAWLQDGTFIQYGWGEVLRVFPSGYYFQLDNVQLNTGDNIISALAFDTAGNMSLPSDSILITLDTSGWADLEVREEDLFIYPPYPVPGEMMSLYATVHNTGSTPAGNVEISFIAVGEDGGYEQIGSIQTIPSLTASAEAAVGVTWDTTGKYGLYRILVQVDPYGKITEASEGNNRVEKYVAVSSEKGFVLSVSTDRTGYGYNSQVLADVRLINPDRPRDVVLDIRVEDSQGYLVADLTHLILPQLGYGETAYPQKWNVGATYPGDYQIHAMLTSPEGTLLTEATAPFKVFPDLSLSAKVVTDKTGYYPTDSVNIVSTVENKSVNSDLSNLTAVVKIFNSSGEEQAMFETSFGLLQGSKSNLKNSWTPVSAKPEEYRVTLEVKQGAATLASSSTGFKVLGIRDIAGTLTVTPNRVGIGQGISLNATVKNTGTVDLKGVELRLLMGDPLQNNLTQVGNRLVDINVGEIISWLLPLDTVGFSPQSYLVQLQGVLPPESPPVTKNLASATFTIVDITAPQIIISSPQAGLYSNNGVVLSVTVSDDASGVDKVEYQIDSGSWRLLPPVDLASGRYGVTYSDTSDHEGSHTFTVRASDVAGNGESTSSADSNPVSVSFTMDITPPVIQVAGMSDGATYNAGITPVITVTDRSPFTYSIQKNGSPFVSGTEITEDGLYVLEVSATDQAGNSSNRVIDFIISRNSVPVAVAGVDQVVRWGETVTLDGRGSHDPDGDTLSYSWAQTAGAPVVLSDPAVVQPAFVTPSVDVDMVLSFELTVTDQHGASHSDSVDIMIKTDQPPVASAGPDQNVNVGQVVTLDGTASSDPDGDLITYRWSVIEVPAGSAVTATSLSDRTGPKPSFTPDVGGAYTFELIVTDGWMDSYPDYLLIQAALPNVPPNAAAGPDLNILTAYPVYLSGAGSNDPDNGPQGMTYEWSFVSIPPGSSLTSDSMVNRFAMGASFTPDVEGEYLVNLRVSDGLGEGDDQVRVMAYFNTPPVARAGGDVTIDLGNVVLLDGSASDDPDQRPSPLTYLWTFVSKPANSVMTNADIKDATTATPSFVSDADGVYVLSLTVTDGAGSSSDNVAVTVRALLTARVYGGAYFLHDNYQEKMSLDVLVISGVVQSGAWLKYYYTKTRMYLVSTQIISVDVAGNTASVAGAGTVNGVTGYKFRATMTNGTPDSFGITIYRPDGTLYYQYSQLVVGGDIIIQQ